MVSGLLPPWFRMADGVGPGRGKLGCRGMLMPFNLGPVGNTDLVGLDPECDNVASRPFKGGGDALSTLLNRGC